MIELHPKQSRVFRDMFVEKVARFFTVICSRGWGKSYLAGTAAIQAVGELMQMSRYVPHKNVYIIAPTFDQVTDIYYPLLNYELGLEDIALKSSKDLGKFWFPNNVELRLVSYEAVERMRGKGAYFVVMDEPSSYKKGIPFKDAWEGIIQPCIITRWSPQRAKDFNAPSAGRALTIGTPKGYNYLYDMYNLPESDRLWKSYQFDYTHSPLLDPAEIERLRHTIDPLEYNREYLARFEDSGNNVFYCFDRKIHVTDALADFEDWETVHVGIDFNVGLMCSVVFAVRGNQIHILDEFKGLPNTEALAVAIKGRYPKHINNIHVYPDPTGRSRKTSAVIGATDFSILQTHGLKTFARTGSPAIVDSVAAVNRKLMTAAGEINMYVHPRCAGAIKSLERTVWVDKNPDTATIDKSEGVEHFSDSIRYPTEYLFPVLAGTKIVSTSRHF